MCQQDMDAPINTLRKELTFDPKCDLDLDFWASKYPVAQVKGNTHGGLYIYIKLGILPLCTKS